MRRAPIALWLLLATLAATPALAQLSINFGNSGVSIGINLGSYPTFQRVPGYPVYYAPGVSSNYFFYDGLYWVYQRDNWYASSWYNGPWEIVDPVYVPTYVLWVPIRFYRRPPAYFRGVRPGNPPRWSEHWGRDWQARHNAIFGGRAGPVPAPAPLPHYQRQYTRENYPRGAQQGALHSQYYGYQRRDAVAQQRPARQEGHRDEGQREQRR